jgi:hypothetical protein
VPPLDELRAEETALLLLLLLLAQLLPVLLAPATEVAGASTVWLDVLLLPLAGSLVTRHRLSVRSSRSCITQAICSNAGKQAVRRCPPITNGMQVLMEWMAKIRVFSRDTGRSLPPAYKTASINSL